MGVVMFVIIANEPLWHQRKIVIYQQQKTIFTLNQWAGLFVFGVVVNVIH